jgi:DNA ligase (NAD+)
VAVRGEIIMKKDIFEKYYPDAASPRNTTLGIINKDNPTDEELSRISFVAYAMYGPGAQDSTRKGEIMVWLGRQGFTRARMISYPEFQTSCLEGMKGLLNPEFPSDGLVITEENDRFDEVAYKFEAESAETTVTKIEWEVSRLGNVIPVVHFNTVKLSGAKLSKCSGFNAKWIAENKIGAGAKIIVHRAGEVIPAIVSIL